MLSRRRVLAFANPWIHIPRPTSWRLQAELGDRVFACGVTGHDTFDWWPAIVREGRPRRRPRAARSPSLVNIPLEDAPRVESEQADPGDPAHCNDRRYRCKPPSPVLDSVQCEEAHREPDEHRQQRQRGFKPGERHVGREKRWVGLVVVWPVTQVAVRSDGEAECHGPDAEGSEGQQQGGSRR